MSAHAYDYSSGSSNATLKLPRRFIKKMTFARRPETFEQYSDRLNGYLTSPNGLEAARTKPASATYTRKKR